MWPRKTKDDLSSQYIGRLKNFQNNLRKYVFSNKKTRMNTNRCFTFHRTFVATVINCNLRVRACLVWFRSFILFVTAENL